MLLIWSIHEEEIIAWFQIVIWVSCLKKKYKINVFFAVIAWLIGKSVVKFHSMEHYIFSAKRPYLSYILNRF